MIAMIDIMIALMLYVAISETTIRIFHFVSINFLAYPYGIR